MYYKYHYSSISPKITVLWNVAWGLRDFFRNYEANVMAILQPPTPLF